MRKRQIDVDYFNGVKSLLLLLTTAQDDDPKDDAEGYLRDRANVYLYLIPYSIIYAFGRLCRMRLSTAVDASLILMPLSVDS